MESLSETEGEGWLCEVEFAAASCGEEEQRTQRESPDKKDDGGVDRAGQSWVGECAPGGACYRQ